MPRGRSRAIAFFIVTLGIAGFVPNAYSSAASPDAAVIQSVGDVEVTIRYSRPGVKGRTVWGELVEYNNGIPYPWRAGANDTTAVEFTGDVLIEGKPLPAGTYGLHMIPREDDEWTVIFSTISEGHGSFDYDEEHDALRIAVTPTMGHPHQEWLQYGFEDLSPTSAYAYLHWEELKLRFKIESAQDKE